MTEEQRCQECHRLCANNCGFFGSPATNDLCSKCHRDLRLKEECASSAKIAVEKSLSSTSPASTPPSLASSPCVAQPEPSDPVGAVSSAPTPAAEDEGAAQPPGRCGTCRKRVGNGDGWVPVPVQQREDPYPSIANRWSGGGSP